MKHDTSVEAMHLEVLDIDFVANFHPSHVYFDFLKGGSVNLQEKKEVQDKERKVSGKRHYIRDFN